MSFVKLSRSAYAEKYALTKLAMFLQMQEYIQSANGTPSDIYLPMDRSDIAGYVAMSLAAASRSFPPWRLVA